MINYIGKCYQLWLTNPSQLKHYFTAKDFADNIWTQKVEAGKVEIKGAIHELELKSNRPGVRECVILYTLAAKPEESLSRIEIT